MNNVGKDGVMMGLIVRCDLCGRDDLNTVYYVGEKSSHCTNCWISIVQAMPNFNIDNVAASLSGESIAESTLQDIPLNQLHNYLKNGERMDSPIYDIERTEELPTIAPEIPKATKRPTRYTKVVSLSKAGK